MNFSVVGDKKIPSGTFGASSSNTKEGIFRNICGSVETSVMLLPLEQQQARGYSYAKMLPRGSSVSLNPRLGPSRARHRTSHALETFLTFIQCFSMMFSEFFCVLI